MSIDQASAAQPTATVTVTAPAPIKAFSEGGDGPSFKDVIDILNPLQHIPVINTIYRHLTGDEEGAVADVGGGALWAGPIGLIGSIADLAVKAESGKTIGDNILSWLGLDDDDAPAEQTKVAEGQQVQQQQMQTAAATAPLPAIAAQSLAPLSRQRDDRKDGKDSKDNGPVKAGDYLVFGAASAGASGNQPISLTPAQSEPDNSGPSRQGGYLVFGGGSQGRGQSNSPPQVQVQTASADASGPSRQGEYMVFGVSVPATAATRPVQVAQAMAPVSATVTAQTPVTVQVQAPSQAPMLQSAAAQSPAAAPTPPGLTPLPSRNFAAPARRAQVTPNSVGMPTTGPAAIPGHSPSQAIPMNQADQTWFAQAVSAGLDKYAAAQKLADQSATTQASTAAGAQASADAFATIH